MYGKAWASFGRELDMISQDVCYFYKAHSIYRNYGGIAFESDEGTSIARALGDNKAMILVNHGLITVGETVDEAAYLYTLLEKSCRIQLMVEATGMRSKNAVQRDVRNDELTRILRLVGLPKVIVRDEEAADTFRMASQPVSACIVQPEKVC
jgi:ribulose-5-phosphate 4-epimerase/fuculose-1-phosphate aldolase